MTWGYVAVAAATVVGGAIQSDSARKASNAQADATGKAVDATTAQADRAYVDQAPYRDAGVQALGQYQTDINKPTTAADVMADPGYQFALDQGQQGIDRKFAASGGRISGASLKAASRFSTGQATSGYGAAYQRGQDRLNRLASLAGLGQTSTQASAQAGANTTNSIGNMMTAQGNAQGAYQIAQGNVWGNAGNQIAALYGRSQQPTGYTGNWQQNAQYGTVQGPYGP